MEFFLEYRQVQLMGEDKKLLDVFVDMKPLEIKDFQKVFNFLEGLNPPQDKKSKDKKDLQASGIAVVSNEKMQTLLEDILPRYCQNIRGIEIVVNKEKGEKRAATTEDLTKYAVFLSYALKMLIQLFTISSVSETEEQVLKK